MEMAVSTTSKQFGLTGVLSNFMSLLNKNASSTKNRAQTTIEKDYSAFGSITAYEKTVVDTLRADGLIDAEIAKCLREL